MPSYVSSTVLARPALIVYWGHWLIYSSNFWKVLVFHFPFSRFLTVMSTSFFLKFVIYLVTLVILVNDPKYIHFYLTFQLPPALHKTSRILLISLQMLVKLFFSNIIIDLFYNFNKYIQYKHVWKLFKVSCLHQHTVIAFIARIGMKSCSKFLRNLVTTLHFTDRNWISKTVYLA